MIKKTLLSFLLLFLFVAPQFSKVSAQYVITGCGERWPFTSGLDILEMEGVGVTIPTSTSDHKIRILYDTTDDISNLYLQIKTSGKQTFTTEQKEPVKHFETNRYSVDFELTDPAILQSFSTTEARDFGITLLTKRTTIDKLCDIGKYTVETETLDLNNPDKYCGATTGQNTCLSANGTSYSSSQFDICAGPGNNNSEYGCCSLNFLQASNNLCPVNQISGCGTWDDSRANCLDNSNRKISGATSCSTDQNICCSQDKVDSCPSPEPDPPPADCGQLVGTDMTEMCKIGDELLGPRKYYACPVARECCRQSTQCTPPTEDPDSPADPNTDTDPTNDVVDPPFQGPTVATFNALNPLITEGSKQATRLSTPGGIVTRFLVFAFPIAGLILFVMLSWAGFEILTGANNQKSLDAGKQRATAAIVGFLLLFASYWLMQIVEVIFGISIL